MRESTRSIFIVPFVVQETVTFLVILPVVAAFLFAAAGSVHEYYADYLKHLSLQLAVAFGLGLGVKYHFASPVMRFLDGEGSLADAEKSASCMPFAEAGAIFFRWTLFPMILVFLPLHLQGKMRLIELEWACAALITAGMSNMAFHYLYAENRLLEFFRAGESRGEAEGAVRRERLLVMMKISLVILFTCLPPLGTMIVGVEYSLRSGVPLQSLLFAFILSMVYCVSMVMINSALLVKAVSFSMGKMSRMLGADLRTAFGRMEESMRKNSSAMGELAGSTDSLRQETVLLAGNVKKLGASRGR